MPKVKKNDGGNLSLRICRGRSAVTGTLRAGHQREPPGLGFPDPLPVPPFSQGCQKEGRVNLWGQDVLRAQALLPLALALSVAERKRAEALEDGKYLLHGWGFSSGPPLYTAMMLPASPFLDLNILIRITQAVEELNSGILLHCELIMWLHLKLWIGLAFHSE